MASESHMIKIMVHKRGYHVHKDRSLGCYCQEELTCIREVENYWGTFIVAVVKCRVVVGHILSKRHRSTINCWISGTPQNIISYYTIQGVGLASLAPTSFIWNGSSAHSQMHVHVITLQLYYHMWQSQVKNVHYSVRQYWRKTRSKFSVILAFYSEALFACLEA